MDPLSSGIGAVASIFNGIFGGAQNRLLQKREHQWQTSEREASQAFQTSEREASQAYQTSERKDQNQFAEDYYMKYQSPQAMYAQYLNAGLNPAVMMSGDASGSVSSGSTGGAPSGSSPGFGSVTPPYVQQGSFADGFEKIAMAFKALGDAKKTGIETEFVEDELRAKIRGMQLSNEAQALFNSINTKYADKDAQLRIQKFAQELETGEITQDKIREEIDYLKANKLIAEKDAKYYEVKLNSQLMSEETERNYKSQQIDNLLSEKKLTQAQTESVYQTARLTSIEANFNEKTFKDRVRQAMEQTTEQEAKTITSICGAINTSIQNRLDKAFKEYEWYNSSVDRTSNKFAVNAIVGGYTSGDYSDIHTSLYIPSEYKQKYMKIIYDTVNDYLNANKVGSDIANRVRIIYGTRSL